MSRPLRIEYPGALYHVTARGNACAPIFLADGDRQRFLAALTECVVQFGWVCHAYCLMGNHYHLMIETPLANISRGMRHLNGTYTQWFNWKYDRAGHLFQGRFKSILVERASYLLELSRYIVLNPVRAGMVGAAGDYRWSSYAATCGAVAAPVWLQTEWLLGQFHAERCRAQACYAAFVACGVGQSSPWRLLQGQVMLGSEEFVRRLEPQLRDKTEADELVVAQRFAFRPPLDGLFGADCQKPLRNQLIRQAHRAFHYSMADIARVTGLHPSSVAKIIHGQR